MKVEIEVDDILIMRYYRMMCGMRTCVNCDDYSNIRDFCMNRKNMESLSSDVENLIIMALDDRF